MNKYWTIFVPAVLGGIMYYAYSSTGFLGRTVKDALDPVLIPVMNFISRVFSSL
jgi:hypothetical protein